MVTETASTKPGHKFTLLKTVIYSLLPALILLIFLECGARVLELWMPPLTLDYGWGFTEDSRVFVPAGIRGNQMVTRPEKLANFRNQSFEMPKPEECFRILALGGSSVYDLYPHFVDMANQLSNTSGETRTFDIIGAGGEGYGTRRLRIMVHEMIGYAPDAVILYSGHNEFVERELYALVDLERLFIQEAVYSSAFMRFVRDIAANLSLTRRFSLAARSEKKLDIGPGYHTDHALAPQEIEKRMSAYRENMTFIITFFQGHGIPVIISTMATNLWIPHLSDLFYDEKEQIRALHDAGKHVEAMALARELLPKSIRPQASDLENRIIRDLAKQFDVHFVDGERLIMAAEPNGVPGETLMMDACHLNEDGKNLLAAAFEEQIRIILEK